MGVGGFGASTSAQKFSPCVPGSWSSSGAHQAVQQRDLSPLSDCRHALGSTYSQAPDIPQTCSSISLLILGGAAVGLKSALGLFQGGDGSVSAPPPLPPPGSGNVFSCSTF